MECINESEGKSSIAELRQRTTTDERDDAFKQLMRTLLERRGRFQLILIVLLSFNSIIIGINHTITTFHIFVPTFFCKDDPSKECYNLDNGTSCPSGYNFNVNDDYTVAVEYELVCDKALMAPFVNSMYFVGVTVGSLICSTLCDIYGRRKLVLLCLYAQAVTAFGQYYSSSFHMFVILRLAQGFFIQGLQTCSYTLIMEFCPSRLRTVAATFWESNWAIGLGILGAVAYFIRNWRLLTLAVTTPAFISLLYVWFFPESLVWLEVKQRRTEALALMRKIAMFNRHVDLVEQCNDLILTAPREKYDLPNQMDRDVSTSTPSVRTSQILRNAVLRKHLLSMLCVWFSVTLSYYGILFYLPNLAGQRHLNFEIGATIELIAYILAYFALSRLGRRIPMTFYQYCNGALLLIIAILTTFPPNDFVQGGIVVIALIGKGLAVSGFGGMFIYGSELFPTVMRGFGLGLCGCSARLGSLLAPQLMSLVRILPAFVPLSIMSVLLIIAASVTLFLPETLNTILPNTILEADTIWAK